VLILVLTIVLENKIHCHTHCSVPQDRGVMKIQDRGVSW